MKNDNKKNKTLLIIGIITTILLLTLGITYAVFSYMQTGEDNHEVVLGDIYMHYQEKNQLLLENAMPSSFKLNTLKLPSVVTGYTVNPVMKEQELNTLSRCMAKMSLEVGGTLDSGQTWEGFCKGEEIFEGDTLQASLNNGLASGLTDAGYSDIFIEEGDIYKPNPIMQTQEVHELTVCYNYFKTAIGDGDIISFCQGTGTLDIQGSSFQGFIDVLPIDIPILQHMINMNLIIQDGDTYIPNPVMQTQTFDELELSVCISEVAKQFAGFDEGTTAETFCKGEGTNVNGQTFQEYLDGLSIGSTETSRLLSVNAILEEKLPEVEYSYTNLIVNPNMEGEVLESCKTIITDLGNISNDYLVNELEKFCQGEAPNAAGKSISELATDTEFLKGDGQLLLRNGVIITDINSPYFEFTISGKNTYSKKDIYYDVVLTHGDNHETRTERIRDDLLRFTLTEVEDNDGEKTLVNGITLYDIKNGERLYVETIPKNTMEEINKTYRLYMNISESTVICGGEVSESCDYYTDKSPNWNDVFASIKVNVSGDFQEKDIRFLADTFREVVNTKTETILFGDDRTIYLSGLSEEGLVTSGESLGLTEAVDYNYVWYSGKLWRITAINPDGTIKMITEDPVTTINWGADATYETSYVRQWLNQDFLQTLNNYENIIQTDYEWLDKFEEPVGLLTTSEYRVSYAKLNAYFSYSQAYLKNGTYWFVLEDIGASNFRVVYPNGSDMGYSSGTIIANVRPAINIVPTIEILSGNGTRTAPYILKEEKGEIVNNTTLINTRQSGEYVKIENDADLDRVFRIVNTEIVDENLTTKLVTNDYVKDTNDLDSDSNITEYLIKKFGLVTSWTDVDILDETYWKGYLNNTWLKGLDPNYNEEIEESSILTQGIYYLGYHSDDTSYKATVCKKVTTKETITDCINNNNVVDSTWKGYVGLLRVGEMFARQPSKYISSTAINMWSITPYNDSEVRILLFDDQLISLKPSSHNYAARPTIHLKSEIVIKSGSGTEQDPFIVGLPS